MARTNVVTRLGYRSQKKVGSRLQERINECLYEKAMAGDFYAQALFLSRRDPKTGGSLEICGRKQKNTLLR